MKKRTFIVVGVAVGIVAVLWRARRADRLVTKADQEPGYAYPLTFHDGAFMVLDYLDEVVSLLSRVDTSDPRWCGEIETKLTTLCGLLNQQRQLAPLAEYQEAHDQYVEALNQLFDCAVRISRAVRDQSLETNEDWREDWQTAFKQYCEASIIRARVGV